MNSGYHALHESCAWVDLSRRGKIIARGEDRARLLHAMSTNHIQQLQPGQGCYAFFLTAQGRAIADADIYCYSDYFLLDTEPETKDKLLSHIDKYIIADDVTLEDATDQIATLEVAGPQSEELLRKLGVAIPEADHAHTQWDTETVARVNPLGFRIFTPVAEKEEVVLALEEAGAVHADEDSYNAFRLERAVPRYGEDITESSLPQETQQTRALHFQKGCYLGQEIVERIRSRGHVNRLLAPLTIDAVAPPAPGTKIQADGKDIGEITSAAYSPALQTVVALGYVRAEQARTGAEMAVNGAPTRLRQAAQIGSP